MEIVNGLDSITPPRLSLSGSADAATKSYHSSSGSVSLADSKGGCRNEKLERKALFYSPDCTIFFYYHKIVIVACHRRRHTLMYGNVHAVYNRGYYSINCI